MRFKNFRIVDNNLDIINQFFQVGDIEIANIKLIVHNIAEKTMFITYRTTKQFSEPYQIEFFRNHNADRISKEIDHFLVRNDIGNGLVDITHTGGFYDSVLVYQDTY